MVDKLIEDPKDAGVSGFSAVKTVRGRLVSLTPEDSKFNKGQQVKGVLKEAEILELFPNAIGEVDLKDDTFTFWLNYTKEKGKPPHQASPYMRVWVASAKKEYSKNPSELIGEVVTITQSPQKLKDKDDKVVEYKFWSFTKDTGEGDLKGYIQTLLVGKNATAASRALALDPRAKSRPELYVAHENGTLAKQFDLIIDADGIYQMPA